MTDHSHPDDDRLGDKISHTDKNLVGRVRSLLRSGRKRGEHFRKSRRTFVEAFAGSWYRKSDVGKISEPINLIQMAANVWTRQLIAGNPAASITPKRAELWPQADDLELDVNQLIREMNLRTTLRSCTLDSMFCCGIAVVGTEANGKEVFADGEWVPTTDTFVDFVDLDDWAQDMDVTRWDDTSFRAHKFRRPLTAAKKDESYIDKVRGDLHATKHRMIDGEGNQKIQEIGAGAGGSIDEVLFDMVDLWHVYFPQQGRIMILPVEGDDLALNSYDWEGPSRGAYHRLGMMDVPGNVMPLAPLSGIADLHFFQNNLFRRVMSQAERAKTVGVIAAKAAGDGKRILSAKDGEFVLADRPEATREVKLGGVDGGTLQMTQVVQRLFSYLGGNIDSLGGLRAQTETVGQDKLIAQASSKLIREMQDRVTFFTKGIVEDIAWWEMQNPLRETTVEKRIPGTSMTFSTQVRPFDFREDASSFEYSVVPFSMADRTPEERMSTMLAFFNGFIAPYGQMLAAEGMGVNFERLIKMAADDLGIPELTHILTFRGDRPDPAAVAQSTERNRSVVKSSTSIRQGRPDDSSPLDVPQSFGTGDSGNRRVA